MFPSHSPAIYEFLKDQHLVGPAQLDELNEEHKATGKPLADGDILGMNWYVKGIDDKLPQ